MTKGEGWWVKDVGEGQRLKEEGDGRWGTGFCGVGEGWGRFSQLYISSNWVKIWLDCDCCDGMKTKSTPSLLTKDFV